MPEQSTYASAGVDIEAGKKATDLMKSAVQATYTRDVLAGLGSFGGLFSGSKLKQMEDPILVASTDGVGTKTRVAARLNRWETIGTDLVNHCINDILVQGATPLFFLDYIASSKLDPIQIATVVRGVANACQAAEAALLGGETAEMPGVYHEGEIDLVGTIVGAVDKRNLIDGSKIYAGNAIMALPSSGIHTNGYTLARHVLAEEDWLSPHPMLDNQPLGEVLLTPHQSYLSPVTQLRQNNVNIYGLAHITGGGVIDNLPRILPEGTAAQIELGSWPIPPVFTLIQELGQVAPEEMYHVFNMGLGMLVIVPIDEVPLVQRVLGDEVSLVGEITEGNGEVVLK